ncbi:MAG: hypothetical protein BGO67_05625 [Alphaproteobacteria bacterium 41-28]|nr:MAG: hypothetical protein BGO67_05625 [Alphaproteobacteria bacterium 41-28]
MHSLKRKYLCYFKYFLDSLFRGNDEGGGKKLNLFDFMNQSPLKGLEISIERDRSKIRDMDIMH